MTKLIYHQRDLKRVDDQPPLHERSSYPESSSCLVPPRVDQPALQAIDEGILLITIPPRIDLLVLNLLERHAG